MHCCGNPLHDIPLWIALALPFVAPYLLYLRRPCRHHHEDGVDHNHETR